MRKIVVEGKVFYWKHGRQSVAFYNEQRKSIHHAYASKILGVDPYVVERARWKRTSDCNVTPSAIAQYIRTHLLEKAS